VKAEKLIFRVSYLCLLCLNTGNCKEEETGRQRNQRISLRVLKGGEKPSRMDKPDTGNCIDSEA
jgi:hypothetical protein